VEESDNDMTYINPFKYKEEIN